MSTVWFAVNAAQLLAHSFLVLHAEQFDRPEFRLAQTTCHSVIKRNANVLFRGKRLKQNSM